MKDIASVASIVACIAVSLLTGVSLAYGFFAAILICGAIQAGNYKWKSSLASMGRSVLEVRMLYMVVFLIGASVASWLAGGVVQTLMVYGLKAMMGRNVILMTFLITGTAGFFMGTAIGTISTLGIAILGIGSAFDIPLPMLLGAAVSGAFISDKLSPLSGLMNLTLSGAGATYKKTVRTMLRTLVPIIAVSALFYGWIGAGFVTENTSQVQMIEQAMSEAFVIHPLLLMLPVMVVGLAFSGKPSALSIGTGVAIGVLFSVFVQGETLLASLKAVAFGYHAETGNALLDGILKSGGLIGMLEVVLIIMGAVALSDFMETSGMSHRLFSRLFDTVKTGRQLLMRSGSLSIIMTALTCDQTAGIVLPLRILRRRGAAYGISPEVSARTISDCGTIVAPLMPWNINALIILGITGIGAGTYAPYAVLCIVSPLISWATLYLWPERELLQVSEA